MGIYQFSKGNCFLGVHLVWCVRHNPFHFIDQSIRAHRGLEFKAQCSEELMTMPELCPGCDEEHHCAIWVAWVTLHGF